MIGKTVNDREKDALKAKVKALEGENEQLSDRLTTLISTAVWLSAAVEKIDADPESLEVKQSGSFRKNYVPLKQRKTSKNSFLRLQRSFTA